MVGARLRNDHANHHRFTVLTQDTAQVFRCQFCPSDVFETDDIVGIFLDDQVVELFCRMHQPQGTDRQIDRIPFDATGRQFHVFRIHGILYVQWGDAIACHLDRVAPQSHGVTFLSPYIHTAYIRDRLQAFFYSQFSYFTQFHQRAPVALHADLHDGSRIGICLGYGRRVAVARQITLGTRYLVAHVVGCRFHIHRQFELDGDTAATLAADTAQGTDTRDTVDVLFQRLRDLVHDNLGVRSRIGHVYRDNGLVHTGELANPQELVADHTEQQDDKHHYRRKYRPVYTGFRYICHREI